MSVYLKIVFAPLAAYLLYRAFQFVMRPGFPRYMLLYPLGIAFSLTFLLFVLSNFDTLFNRK